MTYLEKVKHFNEMQAEGKVMECFEKYYADNCRVIEMPTQEIREGKDAQRQAIKGWFDSVEEMHGSGVKSVTSNEEEGITCCETWFDITFKGGPRVKMEEVAVQKWEGDQIVEEKFYYNAPPQG